MKRLAVILLLAATAHARDVRVSWDLHPEQILGYRLYVNGSLAASTNATTWLLTMGDDQASVSLTAFNAAGESMHAGPLVIPAVLIPPPLTSIERSADMVTWVMFMSVSAEASPELRVRMVSPGIIALERNYAASPGWQLVAERPLAAREFFRLQLPPP